MPDDSRTPTAKHRALHGAIPLHPPEVDSVQPRTSETSGVVAREIVKMVDKSLHPDGGTFDAALTRVLETKLQGLIEHAVAEFNAAASTTTNGQIPTPEPSTLPHHRPHAAARRIATPIAWVLVGVLAAALIVGAVSVFPRLDRVEQRQDAQDDYAMTVANYLVVRANADFESDKNRDVMVRRIAAKIGVAVSDIPAPQQVHPPTAVQNKHRDFKALRGE